MAFKGRKPLVVCNGQAYEADDLDDAREKARELVGQTKTTAWILTPALKFTTADANVIEHPVGDHM